jgi:Zn-dependent protease
MFIYDLFTDPIYFFLRLIAIIIALTVHEFSHAFVAYKFGDHTAKDQGRLTLNPVAHVDLYGLIVMLLIGFGWAKPVLINPNKLTKKQETLVTAAGPFSNLLFAAIIGLLFFVVKIFLPSSILNNLGLVVLFIDLTIVINVMLFLFNLIPLYPLDGSHIFLNLFIPDSKVTFREKFIKYGPMLLIGLIVLDSLTNGLILNTIIGPIFNFLVNLFL